MATAISKVRKIRIGEGLLYTMVWLVVFLIPIMNSKMMSEMHVNLANVFTAWRKCSPYFGIFLLNNLVLMPLLLKKKRYYIYMLTTLALLFVVFFGISQYEEPFWDLPIKGGHASFTDLEWYWNICLGVFMLGTNDFINLLYEQIQAETVRDEQISQQLQVELEYLRYQINPHFLMNTLNNINSLISIDADQAQNAIVELSRMLRYILYDTSKNVIQYQMDMQFIENYIGLMRYRYDPDIVDISFKYEKNSDPTVGIAPLVFVVFIENAFKHGISYTRKSFIDVNIWIEGKMVHGLFVNSRHPEPSDKKHGIGLENVKKRLKLLYPDKSYTLRFLEEENVYKVKISIPIEKVCVA